MLDGLVREIMREAAIYAFVGFVAGNEKIRGIRSRIAVMVKDGNVLPHESAPNGPTAVAPLGLLGNTLQQVVFTCQIPLL